jgi:hypothetical protein
VTPEGRSRQERQAALVSARAGIDVRKGSIAAVAPLRSVSPLSAQKLTVVARDSILEDGSRRHWSGEGRASEQCREPVEVRCPFRFRLKPADMIQKNAEYRVFGVTRTRKRVGRRVSCRWLWEARETARPGRRSSCEPRQRHPCAERSANRQLIDRRSAIAGRSAVHAIPLEGAAFRVFPGTTARAKS